MRGKYTSADRSFFALDTSFVVFFLAVETGRSLFEFGLDSLLLGITLVTLMVVPYFLAVRISMPPFVNWLAGRVIVAAFGLVLGLSFSRLTGTFLPDSLSLLPMTLLIVSAMLSCYLQFYGVLKFRPAK